MKLTRYTSILTAALLLSGAAQCFPASAVSTAATVSAVTEAAAAPADGTDAPSAVTDSPAETTAPAETTGPDESSTLPETVPVEKAAGTVGETGTWTLDTAGALVISCSGTVTQTGSPSFQQYANQITSVEIRNADKKHPVTELESSVFSGFAKLQSVRLPETVTVIGREAFSGCTSLTDIEFPESLTEIGEEAFRGTAFTKLTLPGCAFGNAAFYQCTALKSVTVSEGAEVIPGSCFRYCTALETVYLPDSLREILCGSYESQGSFADCPQLKTVSVGKGISAINRAAFRTTGTGLEVIFREGVTAIPDSAFEGRAELASVILPETLETIGKEAFCGCINLTGTVFPPSLKTIGKEAFRETGLTEAVLPGCALDDAAFYRCAVLKEVTVNEGTERIPSECFRYCTALETVYLPDSLREILCGSYDSQGSFADCPQLKTVSIGKDISAISEFAFRTTGTGLEVIFREGVTAIPDSAFEGRAELASVILPETLETIGKEAFCGCINLTGTVFSPSLKAICKEAFRETGLTEAVLPGCTLDDTAFYRCSALKKVVIGEGTARIPSECFRYCTALETVYLPDSVSEILCGNYDSQGSFADCPQLKTVSIGKGISAISEFAFRTTGTGLEVIFREGVTAIPENAFEGRTELASVILPETLETIGKEAFSRCINLTGTVFPPSLKAIGKEAFRETALTEAMLPGCTLDDAVFYRCSALKKVVISEGTACIPSECFRGCTALETVYLPDSVSEILCGNYDSQGSFADCPQLKTVSIGKEINAINSHAFRTGGTELDVTFRDGAAVVPARAFTDAPLTRVVLPASVKEIGTNALSGCSKLRVVIIEAPECGLEDSSSTLPESAVIYGYQGSTAQDYADKYERHFIPLRVKDPTKPFECDLNGDGKTDEADVRLLCGLIAENPLVKADLNYDRLDAADLDCSGTLTQNDVNLMITLLLTAPQNKE